MSNVLPLFPSARIRPRITFGRIAIASLVDRAVELTCIPRGDIVGPAKYREASYTRFAIIRVAKDSGRTFTQIGRALGRDHTTILAGYRRALELERTDADVAELIRLLRLEAAR